MSIQSDPPATDTETRPGRVRRRRTALWSALAIAVIAALLIAVLATGTPALDRQSKSPLIGRLAPIVIGRSVTATSFSSLDVWRGHWVLVNFFATWCVPCRKEHPQFQLFTARHSDARLVMVIYNGDAAKVEEFFRSEGGDWPAVPDPGGRISVDYGVIAVPETYLIDPNGVVVTKIVGGATADGLDRLLTAVGG